MLDSRQMHSRNFSFFTLDDEINIKDGPVSIVVDHTALMSIAYMDHWDSLKFYEKDFAAWYQNQVLHGGFIPGHPISFIVSSSLLEPYDQDALCKDIMGYLNSPIDDHPDIV